MGEPGSLSTAARLPDGRILVSDHDVYDVERRLQEGDPTYGWPGDPNLFLAIDPQPRPPRWEVHRLCDDGQVRRICVWKGEGAPDGQLIAHIAAHDTRTRDVFGNLEREETLRERLEESDADAHREEVADKLRFALRKDLGAHR